MSTTLMRTISVRSPRVHGSPTSCATTPGASAPTGRSTSRATAGASASRYARCPSPGDAGGPASTDAAMRLPEAFRSLRYRDFRVFFVAQTISQIATWMHSVAQTWLILSLTNSPLLLGLITMLHWGPILLLALPGGAIADRVAKRRLLIATQAAQACTALTVAALVATGVVAYWHVGVLALCAGLANTLFNHLGRLPNVAPAPLVQRAAGTGHESLHADPRRLLPGRRPADRRRRRALERERRILRLGRWRARRAGPARGRSAPLGPQAIHSCELDRHEGVDRMTLPHGTDQLESARLVLRRVAPDDLPFFTRLHALPEVARHLYFGGRPRTPEESAAWLQSVLASYEQLALGYLAVVRKADG